MSCPTCRTVPLMRWKRRSGACCNSAPSGLQYGCSKRARKRFPALFMFEQIMTFCRGFKCGPAWTRTRDLFLIREVWVFLMRSDLYENPPYYGVFGVLSVSVFLLCSAPF